MSLNGSHAFPAVTFPKTILSSTLKEYATGIQFSGPILQEHCIACIVGKSPQHFYSHNGNRASKVGELIHMDMCGPYPVQTLDGKAHFFVMLDDKSNFGVTDLLKLRNEAYSSYCRTETVLLRSYNAKAINVRVDSALELTKGSLGAHFIKQGIVIQKILKKVVRRFLQIRAFL